MENPLTKSPAKLSLKHHLTVPFFSNKPTWCFLASSIGSLADCENDGFEGPGSRSFVAQSIPLDILDLDAQLLGRHRKLFIANSQLHVHTSFYTHHPGSCDTPAASHNTTHVCLWQVPPDCWCSKGSSRVLGPHAASPVSYGISKEAPWRG